MKQAKRILSLLLSLCLVLGLIPGTAFAAGGNLPFTDVNTTDWFYDAVQYAYEKGMMSGTSTTTFSPGGTTTRGMIVTILHRMEGTPAANGTDFTDVPVGQWYSNAVSWASANGIVSGYGNGLFGPSDPITREQMAAILYRYSTYKGYDAGTAGSIEGFSDASQVSSYAVEPMGWAIGNGLISGVGNNTLAPKGNATRAQVATIMKRFCENIADKASGTVDKTYTVTFDLNYGSDTRYDAKTVKEGETVSKPSNPSRSGYSFNGWYAEKSGGKQFDFKTGITSDMTLYAHWSSNSSSDGGGSYVPPGTTYYTVTFDANGGTASSSSLRIASSSAIGTLPTATWDGHTFLGWFTATVGGTQIATSTQVTRNMTVYAQWSTTENGSEDDGTFTGEDRDNDGLDDGFEKYWGADPTLDDTDGDGLNDYVEIMECYTDPSKPDSDDNGIPDADEDYDGDGLTNIEEQTAGTKCNLVDTDGDGLTDFEEVKTYGTDPLNVDTDGDSLTDWEEIQLGLNPLSATSDGVTPDSERTFKQATDDSSLDDSLANSESWLTPSISGNVPGVISNNVHLSETSIYSFDSNRSVVSDIVDVQNAYTSPVTLHFNYEQAYTGDLEHLSIVTYDDGAENGLVMIDTVVDEAVRTISGDIIGSGTYFVIDLNEFLKGLGIDVFANIAGYDTIGMADYSLMSYSAYAGTDDIADPASGSENGIPENEQVADTDEPGEDESADNLPIGGEGTDATDDSDDVAGLGENADENNSVDVSKPDEDTDGNNSADIDGDPLYDNEGNVIGYARPEEETIDFSMFDMVRPYAESAGVTGKADVVFVIDTTGSMGSAISGVKNNVNLFAKALVEDYNVDANFALIEYRDITVDGDNSTILHKSLSSNWFTNVNSLIAAVNGLRVDGGGDTNETPIDALGMARLVDWRGDAVKFVIMVTDAGFKTNNRYGISSMEEMAELLARDNIITSVITYNSSIYSILTEATNGLYGYIHGNFSEILLQLAARVGEITNTGGEWIFLDDFQAVKLKDTLENASGTDSDGDGLMDSEELTTSTMLNMWPYISRLLRSSSVPEEAYEGKTLIEVWKYKSNPTLLDTDFDGISDGLYDYDGSRVTPDPSPKRLFGSSGDYFYGSTNANGYKFDVDFKMDYTLFFKDLNSYQRNLSKLGILYSLGAYGNSINITSDISVSGNDDALMSAFGMKKVESTKLADLYHDDDISEMTIGHREVTYQGLTRDIIIVSVRGTDATIEEWSSNFDVGADTDDYWDRNNTFWTDKDNHKGFEVAANRLRIIIEKYIESLDSKVPKILYFTGHSRGAAISNILAAKFTDKGYRTTSYNFATPNTTDKSKSTLRGYTSIFNIVNKDDIVPYLPLEDWGFDKYGTNYCISIKDSYEYKPGTKKENSWEEMFGRDYNFNGNKEKTLKAFIKAVGSRENLYRFTGGDDTMYTYKTEYSSKSAVESAAITQNERYGPRINKFCRYYSQEVSHLFSDSTYKLVVEQCPAAMMMILTDVIASSKHEVVNGKDTTTEYKKYGNEDSFFGNNVGFFVAKKYADAKKQFVWSGSDSAADIAMNLRMGGMVHGHMPGTYYLLANDAKNLLP